MEPLDSKVFGIGVIEDLDRLTVRLKILDGSVLNCKVALLPFDDGYACMPLVHNDI